MLGMAWPLFIQHWKAVDVTPVSGSGSGCFSFNVVIVLKDLVLDIEGCCHHEVAVPRDLQVDDCIVVEEDGEADDGLATSSELNKSETPYAINAGHNKRPSEKDPDGDTVNDTLSNINNAGHSVAPSFEDKKGNNVSDVPSGTFRGLLLGLTLVSLLAQTCLIDLLVLY